jgi:hypothetical protein
MLWDMYQRHWEIVPAVACFDLDRVGCGSELYNTISPGATHLQSALHLAFASIGGGR